MPSFTRFQDSRYRELIGNLIDRRKKLGLSQAALAQLLATHQQFVSRYELGERRLDIVEFADVACALGLKIDDLLGGLGD